MQDLISVIIPVYKVEAYLDACVEGVLAQTYENLEIILVEDGSPDRCGELCDAWTKRDRRVRVIHKENEGPAEARNRGMQMARGAYLFFVDSDDWIEKDTLMTLYQLAKKEGADIAMTISDQGKPSQEALVLDGKGAFSYCLEEYHWEAWGKLIDRKLMEGLLFPKGVLHEDLALVPFLLLRAKKVAVSEKVLYHYTVREGGIMGHDLIRISTDLVKVVQGCVLDMAVYQQTDALFYQKGLKLFCNHLERRFRNVRQRGEQSLRLNRDFIRAYCGFLWGNRGLYLRYRPIPISYFLLRLVRSWLALR